ncbi:MAG: HEAT repeat domain-containing protein [Leptolyngbya sp. RL_3_1]|nr:HEAT repeat domain-containing protein [Leptolyngbya sp. RL_3_1]
MQPFIENNPLLKQVLADLVGGDFQQRWEAVKQLPAFGADAIAPLLALLVEAEDAEDEALQWFVIRSLGNYSHPKVMAVLVDVLSTAADPDLQDAAVTALAQLGEAGIEAILPLLQSPERKGKAVQILTCLQTARVVGPLLSVVKDDDPTVRAAAIAALGAFRDPEITPALLAALSDPVVAVRREAVVALGRDRDRQGAENWVDRLGQCLWDPDAGVGQAAATALGRLRLPSAIPHLAPVLRSPQSPEPLKRCVIRSLGWIGQSTALTVLISTWDDGSEAMRLAIVEALGRCSQPPLQGRAQQQLRHWLTSVLPEANAKTLKQALALALGQGHDYGSVDLLQRLMVDADPQVQVHGAAALRLLGISAPTIPANPIVPLATLDTKTELGI